MRQLLGHHLDRYERVATDGNYEISLETGAELTGDDRTENVNKSASRETVAAVTGTPAGAPNGVSNPRHDVTPEIETTKDRVTMVFPNDRTELVLAVGEVTGLEPAPEF